MDWVALPPSGRHFGVLLDNGKCETSISLRLFEIVINWFAFVFIAVVQRADGELQNVLHCGLLLVPLHACDSARHPSEL